MDEPTPGPWLHAGTLIYALGEQGGSICELSELRKSTLIGHERLELNSPDWDEQMANGRLLAAAREMYDALCSVRDVIGNRPTTMTEQSILILIEDALDKAEHD